MLIDNSKVIVEEYDLVETFYGHLEKPRNYISNTNLLDDDVAMNKIVRHYSSHTSIIKIREKFVNSENIAKFQFNSVKISEILKLLTNIDEKKATKTDKIPPKLVKLSATVLSQPLRDAINNSVSKGTFPNNPKVAFVSPFDKPEANIGLTESC